MTISWSPQALPSVSEDQVFSTTVEFFNTVPDPSDEFPNQTKQEPVNVLSAKLSLDDSSVKISFEGNKLTIAGSHLAFPNKFFNYIPFEQPKLQVKTSFGKLPEKLDTLFSYEPPSNLTETVTYTVVTSAGTIILLQGISTSWDLGNAQLKTGMSRSAY